MLKYIRSIYLIFLLTLVLSLLAAFCLVMFRLLVYSSTGFDFISKFCLIIYPLLCIVSLHAILHGFPYFLVYTIVLLVGSKVTKLKFVVNKVHLGISVVLWYVLRIIYFDYVNQVLSNTSTETIVNNAELAQKALLTLQGTNNEISVTINVLSSLNFIVFIVVFLVYIANVLTILSKKGKET